MSARKVYLVTLENGLGRYDYDWDIVGIYNLDKLQVATADGIAELRKMDDHWYRNASVTIWKVWIDKVLDYTAADKVAEFDVRSLDSVV